METRYSPHTLEHVRAGDQIYWLSDAPDTSEQVAVEFAKQALEHRDALLYLFHLRDPKRSLCALAPELEAAAHSGQLRFESALGVFLPNGFLKIEDAIAELGRAVDAAIGAGFRCLRIVVEMTWVFEAALGSERIAEYEHRLQAALLDKKQSVTLAKYDRQYFKPAILLDLLSCYRQVLIESELYDNFYYVPPNHSLVQQHQAAVLHQSLETLRALGRAERAIEERSKQLKQSETALEMLHSIIDSMGDGVFVVDEVGDMIFCNKSSEHILGYGLLDLPLHERVRKIGNFLPPEGVVPYPVEDLPIARATRGESSNGVEIIIRNDRRPQGVWLSANGRPLKDRHGNIKGGLVVFRDVTGEKRAQLEQERLEEQMFRTQKLESLGVLAGGIAHDFNNLLMGVLGNADLALKEASPATGLHNRIAHITTAARRLADLTNQLLAYSGQGPFAQEQVQLSTLVREMAELLRPAVSKRATVQYDLDALLPAVLADPTQLRQIVMNLITNASDAIGDTSGTIHIRTGTVQATEADLQNTYLADQLAPGTYVALEITDTGCGMDETTLARIFDPFFTTKFTGRGLGLAAVLGIVRRHNGTLQVESHLGKGTKFRVLFPALDTTDVQPESDASQSPWNGEGKILVVDDEQAVRDIAGEMLRLIGFEPLVAATAQQALELVRTDGQELRAVILDLTMPDMDGDILLEKLREQLPELRVVLSSGYHEAETIGRFKHTTVSGYLQKPYGHEQLRRTLRKALAVDA